MKVRIVVSCLLVLSVLNETARAQDDLDIRFSKVTFDEDFYVPENPELLLPLTSEDYPITLDTFYWLRYSQVVSVIIPEACVGCVYPSSELIEAVGGLPSHPSSDPNDPYWDDLHEVVKVQHLRRQGASPLSVMPLPYLWQNYTMHDVAEAVHGKYPSLNHISLLQHMDSNKMLPHYDYNVVPFASYNEFLRGLVMYSDLVTWAICRVAPMNFGVKYHVGRARPEEVVHKIVTGEIPRSYVPADLLADILALNVTTPESFTAYPEGSPKHPSWPAMHSAGSAMSIWLPVVVRDMTEEQKCQVRLTDYAVAYARTVAGVHFPTDNIAGLNLGQEIVARMLPDYMHEMYGSNKARVIAKIEVCRFDWNEFLDSDCAKGRI